MNSLIQIDGNSVSFAPGVQGRGNKFSYKLGEIINASVVSVNGGRASFETKSGFYFESDAELLKVSVGDALAFEVVKSDKSGITLRQILTQRDTERVNAKQASADELRGLMKQNNLLAEASEQTAEERQKTAAALARSKRQLN